MTKFERGVAQLLEKRGQIIVGIVGYQYGGHDAQLNDTDYFVCDVEEVGKFDFAYTQSSSQFSVRELIFLLLGGVIRETSGYAHPNWEEVFYRTPSL